jgi:hypothetical protein
MDFSRFPLPGPSPWPASGKPPEPWPYPPPPPTPQYHGYQHRTSWSHPGDIYEEAGNAKFTINGDKVAIEDRSVEDRYTCVYNLTRLDFEWFITSRAAATFMSKLNVTEDDFCKYVIPGSVLRGPLFAYFWPIVETAKQRWLQDIFHPNHLYIEV